MRFRPALVVLTLAAIAAFALAAVPILVQRPFAEQTPAGLAWAYRLARIAPWATLALLVAGAVLAWQVWRRGAGKGSRALAAAALFLLTAAAVLSRIAPAELSFAPLEGGPLVPIAEAGLAPESMVLGVVVDGAARAYPLGVVAYHHVINDRLRGEPFVVTF